MPRFDVVGIGIAACDYLIQLDRLPGPDVKVRADDLQIEGGGTVGTALVAAARLGAQAAYAGVVGDDVFGRFILDGLEKEGVDTSLARTAAGARSPFAFCVSVPPARTVFSVRSTTPPLTLQGKDLEAALDTRAVHLDGTEEEASLTLAAEAKVRGILVSVDLQRTRRASDKLLELADLAVVAESYALERYPGRAPLEAVREMWRPGMHMAAITLGARGLVACDGGDPYEVPAEPTEVVDSTGAGDVFHGALLVAVLEGHAVRKSLEFASHVAALSCRALGGRSGIPRRDEVGDAL